MSKVTNRALLGMLILGAGSVAQLGLEASLGATRPPLRAPLASLPYQLGDWLGRDEPLDPEILERTQADDFINRVYEDPRRPGRVLKLWMNYSRHGLNLRHSPEVCLPSGGWSKLEAMSQVIAIPGPDGGVRLSRLGYAQGDFVQGVGFWYYIFGEGPVERFVRALPISSQSSHGRATRGSGLTVEIFYPAEFDADAEVIRKFAAAVLEALDPLLPIERSQYHLP